MGLFKKSQKPTTSKDQDVWARPEMQVTFRAEIMPGKSSEERTYRIQSVLANGRVRLYDFPDEHRRSAFEPVNFQKIAAAKNQNS